MDKLEFINNEIKSNEDQLRELEEKKEHLRGKIAHFKDLQADLESKLKREEKTFGLEIVSWNINNFREKFEINDVKNYLKKFDIVCLTESMSTDNEQPKLEGFETYNYPRERYGRISGGISVLVKKPIEVEKLDEFDTAEVSWLRVEDAGGLLFLLGVVYNPPQSSAYANTEFFDDIPVKINEIRDTYKLIDVVLTGDFNARTGHGFGRQSQDDQPPNVYGHQMNDFCSQNGFQIINGRTPGDSQGSFTYVPKSTVVDYVLLQNRNFTEWKYDLEVDNSRTESDHRPLVFKFQPHSKINDNLKTEDQETDLDQIDELSTDMENLMSTEKDITKKIKFTEE